MRRCITLSLTVLLFIFGGCTVKAVQGPDARPAVLGPRMDTAVPTQRAGPAYGSEAPYTPVVYPPILHRVWVLPRQTAYGDLLAGYWWHILEKDWTFGPGISPHKGYHPPADQPLTRHAPPPAAPASVDHGASNSQVISKARAEAAIAAAKAQARSGFDAQGLSNGLPQHVRDALNRAQSQVNRAN